MPSDNLLRNKIAPICLLAGLAVYLLFFPPQIGKANLQTAVQSDAMIADVTGADAIENEGNSVDASKNETAEDVIHHEASAVFVVKDQGCPACNSAFVNFASDYVNDPECLFLIQASGLKFDIGSFLENEDNDNVIIDFGARKQVAGLEDCKKDCSFAAFYEDGKWNKQIIELTNARTVLSDIQQIRDRLASRKISAL